MIDQQAPHPCLCDGAAFCEECHLACHCSSSAETLGVTAGETATINNDERACWRERWYQQEQIISELKRDNLNLRGEIDRLQHLWDKCGICEENPATHAVHGDDSSVYTGPICDDCDPPPRGGDCGLANGVTAGETALQTLAAEFVRYWTTDRTPDGCGMCGGIPHSTTCYVGRMAALLGSGTWVELEHPAETALRKLTRRK